MRFIFTGLFLFFGTFVSRGQTSSSTPPADSSAIETSIFSLGTSYGNNASYYGQSSAEGKLPYATLSSTYQAANGLYGSVSLVRLLQSGPGISEIDLSAGYAFDITKKLSGTVNYIRYFFAKNSPLLQTANNNTARASLTYDWWLNSSLYGDYAFGEDNSDYFLTLENYKTIDLGAFSSSDYVTIEPSLQLTAGTNSFSESYQVRKGRKLPGPLDPLLGGGRGGRTETVT